MVHLYSPAIVRDLDGVAQSIPPADANLGSNIKVWIWKLLHRKSISAIPVGLTPWKAKRREGQSKRRRASGYRASGSICSRVGPIPQRLTIDAVRKRQNPAPQAGERKEYTVKVRPDLSRLARVPSEQYAL